MRRKLVVFLVFLASSTLVYSSVAYYLMSTPSAQGFMGLGVFSDKGTLTDYFRGPGATAVVNQTYTWQIQVANRMGSIQMAKIIFRLGNLTTASPSQTSPSNVAPIGEATTFVPNGDNSTISFTWRILRITQSNGQSVLSLMVNGGQVSSSIGASSAIDYRLLFELWTLENLSETFQYGWQSQNGRIGAWLHVWFNATS